MAPNVKVPMNFGLRLKDSPTHNTLKLNTSNGETVYASSVILSFNSPVIDHMTTTLCMTSVDMLEFSKTAVDVFVDAAYSGKADGINKEVFRDVNKMATVFEMKWLAEKCAAFFNQLVAAIKEPLYKELMFLCEEAGFVLKTLKLADYIIVVDKKLRSMGCKQQFIEWYLKDIDNLSTDKLDMVLALAGKELKCVVPTVVDQLSELYKVQGPCLLKPYKYLLENCSLHLCKQQHEKLFEQLFEVLRSLPDEHMRWTFDLHRKSCSGEVNVTDLVCLNTRPVTSLLPCHNLDLSKTLEELVDWLSVSEKCTSLLMAVEAVSTWRQYHIRTIGKLTPGVLSNLYDKLKIVAKKRGWSLLPQQLSSYIYWYGHYENNTHKYVQVDTFDMSFLTCNDSKKIIFVDSVNDFRKPFPKSSTDVKLLFHFKHPAISACNRLSNCGFILKTVPSEGALWRVKLCTEEEDYRNEMIHFHEEVKVEKIHLCFIAETSESSSNHLNPLSWLGWIVSEEQRQEWVRNYDIDLNTQGKGSLFKVLYDTTN